MHRGLAALIALAALASSAIASSADAQIMRVPQRGSQPVVWASASAGILQVQDDIIDGRTQSAWRFGTTLQYRGTIEMEVGGNGAVGFALGYANAPLTYAQSPGVNPAPDCSSRCDAHAQIWSLMGAFHMGGGIGFHQIIDISAGVTVYRDFRSDELNSPLGPESPDKDLALSVGYGFGWGFTPRLQLMLVQDAAYTLHQRDGLSGGADNSTQIFTTRLGARIGLGSRAR